MPPENTAAKPGYDALSQAFHWISAALIILALLPLGFYAHWLGDGPVRFNQIRRQIEGISQKVLSQTLKSLECDGLVNRKAIPTVPVTVEYSITPLGKTLSATVDGLRVWAETHIDKVLKAQKQYDAGLQRTAA